MAKLRARGMVSWMIENPVAANIMLFVFLAGGLIQLSRVKQEIYPEFALDFVTVSIAYPGASPQDIESGILLALEEAVRGVDGIKRLSSFANEGLASATIEVASSADPEKVLNDVSSAVDQIRSFPRDAHKPVVKRITAKNEVISLVVYGDTDDQTLRHYGELARDGLLDTEAINLVDLLGTKSREIAVEVGQGSLAAHGLTLQGIAHAIAQDSVDIPAGHLKTTAGELALRTNDRMDFGHEYEDIIIKSTSSGENLRLKDIAVVSDTFADSDQFSLYNGQPALMVRVYRTGEQGPIEVANAVKDFAKGFAASLPPNLKTAIWNDYSSFLASRMNLLMNDAISGILLVFLVLTIFLNPRLAFWVTMGIPTSFLGACLFLPVLDISFNMISLFAFIITLGMVVDDAIVIGENIYEFRSQGVPPKKAAILGTNGIALPVVFAVLTTMVAFAPLLFVPGVMGKFFYFIPVIVILVFLVSTIESTLIMPSHLAHIKLATPNDNRFLAFISAQQQRVRGAVPKFVDKFYRPMLTWAINHCAITISMGLSMLILVLGLIAGGRIDFSFMPQIDSDVVLLHAEFAVGSPVAESVSLQKALLAAADQALLSLKSTSQAQSFYSQIGSPIQMGDPMSKEKGGQGAHMLDMMVYLVPSDQRHFTSDQFIARWQQELPEVAGLKKLIFKSISGPSPGQPISFQLKHHDVSVLEDAALQFAHQLENYQGLFSIDDGISQGKEQIEFKLKENAHALGLSSQELGQQIRDAFYGAEAIRRQRDRDEVRVMVRLPPSERASIFDIENFRVQVGGQEVLLHEVANVISNKGYAQINREDGDRVITISSDIVAHVAQADHVIADLEKNWIPKLKAQFPGLGISRSGAQREQEDTLKSLGIGFVLALLVIYGLLALPLKSYIQPLIVMSAIPFALIGATLGHVIMGYSLSIISIMGLVSLSGIVVKDSLVFIHAFNEQLADNNIHNAVINAGIRRFRPIWLTSLTTFFGLAPMITETSVQARFLVPMAISIGFGVIFATAVTLVLVPVLCVVVHNASLRKSSPINVPAET